MVYHVLTAASMELLREPYTAPNARFIFYTSMTWFALTPLVVWCVLRADIEYWRGLDEQVDALQQIFQRTYALQGRISAHGLLVSIEMFVLEDGSVARRVHQSAEELAPHETRLVPSPKEAVRSVSSNKRQRCRRWRS
jgi:hypothetical protein